MTVERRSRSAAIKVCHEQQSFSTKYAAEIVKPGSVHNFSYHFVGEIILVLNKIRHEIQGYRSPRSFPVSEIQKAIAYDFAVVEKWLDVLRDYVGSDVSLKSKTVLELGPGADLGVGLILLKKGADTYHAIDINNLVSDAPDSLYDALFREMEHDPDTSVDAEWLRLQLGLTRTGRSDRLNYICRKEFDITVFKGVDADFVFSQAAFEHFDDVEKVVAQTSEVVRPGAVLISEIDLQTHSRWIRDADPLNIYRYSDLNYRSFRFSGSPNRWRPYEYEQALSNHGWKDTRIFPGAVLDQRCLSRVRPSLNERFRSPINQMEILNMVICATKA